MKNIKLIIISIIFIIIFLVLGIYGKFILCTLLFIFSIVYGLAKEKKLYILSFLCILLIPNIFIDFKINNLNFDKNGLFIHNKFQIDGNKYNSYYYAICPFITEVCYSKDKLLKIWGNFISLKNVGEVPSYNYYMDYKGSIYFSGQTSKREKYLDNKALSQTSILYKTIFIPFSKEDLIIYNYNIGEYLNIEEILDKNNKCELLLYGAQNWWDNYRKQLIKELENKSNQQCLESLNKVLLNEDAMTDNKIKFLEFIKSNRVENL